MSNDPGDGNSPDGLAESLADVSDERVEAPTDALADALADVSDEDLQAALLKRLRRIEDDAPRESGDQVRRLDMDNPPAAPDGPLLQIGYTLLPQLPENWETVFLQISSAVDDVRTFALVRMQEIESPDNRFHYFSGFEEPSLALRRSTYEPDGRGAWYNAQIRLSQDGTINAKFDFFTPPFGAWGPNEVALVIRDQSMYPRDPARLPLWHPAR